jgi:hypothetical protein
VSKRGQYVCLQPLLLAKFERMLVDGEPEQILKLPHMAWGICVNICASAEHVTTRYIRYIDGSGYGMLAEALNLLPEGAEQKLLALADRMKRDVTSTSKSCSCACSSQDIRNATICTE